MKIWENDANNPSGVTKPISIIDHWSLTQIMVESWPPMHYDLSFNVPCIYKALTTNGHCLSVKLDSLNKQVTIQTPTGPKRNMLTKMLSESKKAEKFEDTIGDVGKAGLKIELSERPNMSKI